MKSIERIAILIMENKMKNKYVKNLYQIISFSFSASLILIPLIIFYVDCRLYESENGWILLACIAGWIALWFCSGFYWIFQVIQINHEGITVKFFSKILRKIKWDDIVDIQYQGVMRNPAYVIMVKDEKNLNLDSRKKIKQSFIYYAPVEMQEILKRLK